MAQKHTNVNPYEPPVGSDSSSVDSPNSLGRIGFLISLTGIAGLLTTPFGPGIGTVGARVAFLALPGTLVSSIGLIWHPRRLAKWGVALGVFCSMYLPTLYLSLFGHL